MKKLIVVTLILVCICLIKNIMDSGNGRYAIYMNPIVRADQLLLDTRTGRTWQFTQESKEKYMFWHEIPRDELPLLPEETDKK